MTPINIEIIEARRKKLKISQSELAKRMGISRSYYTLLKTGKRLFRLSHIEIIWRELNLPLNKIILMKKINTIEITHIKWDKRRIGIALHKLVDGDNKIIITAKGKDGKPYYPNPLIVNKKEAVAKYGVEIINHNNLKGIWIPLAKAFVILLFLCSVAFAETASWYSYESCKREGTSGIWTASGERFNENDLTAAMWDVPFNTLVEVTNLDNNKTVIVRINDRGAAKKYVKQGRIIDLSKGAFSKIANLDKGLIKVKIKILGKDKKL